MRNARNYNRLLYTLCGAFMLCSTFLVVRPVHALTMSPIKLELAADPGSTLSGEVKAYNEEKTSKTFFLDFQNFEAKDESGAPLFSPSVEGLAKWISGPESVTLGPLERKNIPITITIPKNTEPGGYFTGMFMRSTPPSVRNESAVAIGGQVGTLILLRVNGQITEGADVLEFETRSHNHWFTALPIEFYYRFQNSGQDWVKPLGDILIKNWFGRTSKIIQTNREGGNVLPRSIRRFEAAWISNAGKVEQSADLTLDHPTLPNFWTHVTYEWNNFAFGRYTALLNLAYGNSSAQTAKSELVIWVIPWHFLLVAVPSLVVLLIILRFTIKKYNRYIVRKAQTQKKK